MEETLFWIRFNKLCDRDGMKVTTALRKIGISTSYVTRWKNGGMPNVETIRKIAKYFSVPESYFIEVSKEDDLNEYLEELRSRPELKMMFSLAKDASKEDVEQAVRIIEALWKK